MEREEISFGYIKAESIDSECEARVYELLGKSAVDLVWVRDVFMTIDKLKRHQPILFDLHGDINDIWKTQGAERLVNSTVRTLGVVGKNAINELSKIKPTIREEFVSPCEFDRERGISYPNFMHAANDKEQVENDVRILVPDKLKIVRSYNGVNELTKKVW